MKLSESINRQSTQAEFAELVGISEARVSQLMSDGRLQRGDTGLAWLWAYLSQLREQAAGRSGDGGGFDLVQERAGLAHEQRLAQRMKNDVARGTYAPIELLSDVLATAAQSVADRIDALPAAIMRVCPDLPASARKAIESTVYNARAEWSRKTAVLVLAELEADEDADLEADLDEDEAP